MKEINDDFYGLLEENTAESLKACRQLLEKEEARLKGDRERLKLEELFFEKKMAILKGGFEDLEKDRKKLEREKIAFEAEKDVTHKISSAIVYEDIAQSLFAGVNSYLALKKRYRDLLKIFHPDNMCGDTEMVTIITREYEKLKDDFEYNYKSVN